MRKFRAFSLAVFAGIMPAFSITAKADDSMHLSYEVDAHWVEVLRIDANITLNDQQYGITTQARADGLIALFTNMNTRSAASGSFQGNNAIPFSYDSSGWSRGAMRKTSILYKNGHPATVLVEPPEPQREPVSEQMRWNGQDVLSTAVHILHQVRKTSTCSGIFDIFDGLRLTRLTLKDEGEVTKVPHARKGWEGKVLRCSFVGQQLAGFVLHDGSPHVKKPYHGVIWFQDVPPTGRQAVRIELEHPKMGSVTAILKQSYPINGSS